MTDEQLHCVDVWDDGVTWAEGHLRRRNWSMLSCVMPYMTFAHTNLTPFRTYCG